MAPVKAAVSAVPPTMRVTEASLTPGMTALASSATRCSTWPRSVLLRLILPSSANADIASRGTSSSRWPSGSLGVGHGEPFGLAQDRGSGGAGGTTRRRRPEGTALSATPARGAAGPAPLLDVGSPPGGGSRTSDYADAAPRSRVLAQRVRARYERADVTERAEEGEVAGLDRCHARLASARPSAGDGSALARLSAGWSRRSTSPLPSSARSTCEVIIGSSAAWSASAFWVTGPSPRQPGQRGQDDELHVRQPVRLQRRALGGLPAVGDLPEQQPGALVGVVEPGGEPVAHAVAPRGRRRPRRSHEQVEVALQRGLEALAQHEVPQPGQRAVEADRDLDPAAGVGRRRCGGRRSAGRRAAARRRRSRCRSASRRRTGPWGRPWA